MTPTLPRDRAVEPWPAEDLEILDACPVCAHTGNTVAYTGLVDRNYPSVPGVWTYYRCGSCGSLYVNPRPLPETIGRAYEQYFTHEKAASTDRGDPRTPLQALRYRLLRGYLNLRYGYHFQKAVSVGWAVLMLSPIRRAEVDREYRNLRLPAPGARLLDVGCGQGAYVQKMRQLGWRAEGIEPDPAAVVVAREEGLEVREGILDADAYPSDTFEAVTLSHVIEHVHDPLETLRQCYRVLKPGGVLWLACPNAGGSGYRQFGESWVGLDPPRHLIAFTPGALRDVINRAGFGDRQAAATPHPCGGFFGASLAIRQEIPAYLLQPLPPDLARAARHANIRALWQPLSADELALMAWK